MLLFIVACAQIAAATLLLATMILSKSTPLSRGIIVRTQPLYFNSALRKFTVFNHGSSRSTFINNFGATRAVSTLQSADPHLGTGLIGTRTTKRNVALVCSYLGSNYSGLQMDETLCGKLRFVESELKDALVKIGAISPSNSGSLSKIRWSRSSRTDKGVHAARIVISAKLELDPRWLDNNPPAHGHDAPIKPDVAPYSGSIASGATTTSSAPVSKGETVRFKELVQRINEELPDDIRVFSCVKINSAFHARESCSWRQYEYLMPASILTAPVRFPQGGAGVSSSATSRRDPSFPSILSKPTTFTSNTSTSTVDGDIESVGSTGGSISGHGEEIVIPAKYSADQLDAALLGLDSALREMEGTHSFHNFNRISSKDLRKQAHRSKRFQTEHQQSQPTSRHESRSSDGNKGLESDASSRSKIERPRRVPKSPITVGGVSQVQHLTELIRAWIAATIADSGANTTTTTTAAAASAAAASPDTTAFASNVGEESGIEVACEAAGHGQGQGQQGLQYYNDWSLEPKPLLKKSHASVYCCRVHDVCELNGETMIIVRVRGSGFLLQ